MVSLEPQSLSPNFELLTQFPKDKPLIRKALVDQWNPDNDELSLFAALITETASVILKKLIQIIKYKNVDCSVYFAKHVLIFKEGSDLTPLQKCQECLYPLVRELGVNKQEIRIALIQTQSQSYLLQAPYLK